MLNINGGLIEVFDFGSGPFTGPLNLDIIVASKSDYVNLGLRVDDGTNSYIMPIYANLLDADLAYQRKPKDFAPQQSSEGSGTFTHKDQSKSNEKDTVPTGPTIDPEGEEYPTSESSHTGKKIPKR